MGGLADLYLKMGDKYKMQSKDRSSCNFYTQCPDVNDLACARLYEYSYSQRTSKRRNLEVDLTPRNTNIESSTDENTGVG